MVNSARDTAWIRAWLELTAAYLEALVAENRRRRFLTRFLINLSTTNPLCHDVVH